MTDIAYILAAVAICTAPLAASIWHMSKDDKNRRWLSVTRPTPTPPPPAVYRAVMLTTEELHSILCALEYSAQQHEQQDAGRNTIFCQIAAGKRALATKLQTRYGEHK